MRLYASPIVKHFVMHFVKHTPNSGPERRKEPLFMSSLFRHVLTSDVLCSSSFRPRCCVRVRCRHGFQAAYRLIHCLLLVSNSGHFSVLANSTQCFGGIALCVCV